MIEFKGISLFSDFRPGNGLSVEHLPAVAGVYAEVYWPARGVRIGETGRSIRGKIRHDIRWFNAMYDGTAPPEQLRRTLPIAEAAKHSGAAGFEFFVVSSDERLADKALRQEVERHMFAWVRQSDSFVDWNRQRSWR